MEKRVSRKALALLTSPWGLAAMAVLLVNDAVLRVLWPSWVTGKLGDLAWLLFFPFALAWGLGLLLPRREGLVRGLAFGITGGVFALAKALPAGHAAVVGAAEALLGRPVIWVRDPWDLVTLVSLAAGWMLWGRAADATPRERGSGRALRVAPFDGALVDSPEIYLRAERGASRGSTGQRPVPRGRVSGAAPRERGLGRALRVAPFHGALVDSPEIHLRAERGASRGSTGQRPVPRGRVSGATPRKRGLGRALREAPFDGALVDSPEIYLRAERDASRGSTGQRPVPRGRVSGATPRERGSGRAMQAARVLGVAAAALLTIANSARPPSIGVECLAQREGAMYSLGWDRGYVSRDGGLTWTALQLSYNAGETEYSEDGVSWLAGSELSPRCAALMGSYGRDELSEPRVLEAGEAVQYRYVSGGPIERSEDGGTTWRVDYERRSSPAEAVYYEQLYGVERFTPGPLDAVFNAATGNAVFAMGAEGVLVRTAEGAWTWVAVGEARRAELRRGEGLFTALAGELMLAVGFGLLGLMTLLGRWRRGKARKIALGLFWALWGLDVLLMPELRTGYGGSFNMLMMWAGCIYLAVHLVIELALMLTKKQARVIQVGQAALTALLGAALFFAPYVAWVVALLPWYAWAVALALVLGVVVLLLGWRWVARGERGAAQA